MAVIDTTTVAGGKGNALSRTVQNIIAQFNAWNDARITRSALARLSDRELEDIGISRAEIDTIAG
ncbi:DUF1127 domain-containing protein [Roseovarius rhodophyticola]|uniref:DUF1127 domain-containing protein n=1 Tax=Roseovarius rhodophyticola TaxID=3080827 RepID=A0ABZ2TC05_9RHOB|nr:DUF1127 domain-containing protein [Roseovarius sp. W115]MDV2930896.1 DUF1127 domain-containing protein [Roseovarius sp. W115]